ncbi:N-acetylmuramoyl-L-alanine amidase [Candidatus Saccharibacteria bacterium]|nr:N-acetylmuramoyl-L-alanine amidase [Candidatus Saccharibacteria bacterium]
MVKRFGFGRILALGALVLVVLFLVVMTNNANAAKKNLTTGRLAPAEMQEFSQNNILYYDPSECLNSDTLSSRPSGDEITWIGDSYSTGAQALIEASFPGISFGGSVNDANSTIQACKNVAMDTDCNANPTNPSALNVLKRVVTAGELKPWLVMAVGTNEGWSNESIAELKQILSGARDTKVVVVTSKTANSDYTESNERLRRLVNEEDNYYLADWAAVSDPSYFAEDSIHPVSNGGYEKWVETIYNAFPVKTTSSGKIAGTGNFAKILSAKNADKSFFNGSGDVPSARWSDTDTASMKQLVETYGDLAYQLGDVVGAPWIAILVQMRYEDPDSVCGKNNFWGNGCPPGTGAGGASKQGENLGEGFVQYAETLTNGYHDQAIGVADPKEYLEAIGPTWVQGDINGAGYGSIEAMKKSVDALQAFVDSSEGQAIVKEFGNYHGRGTDVCRCGETAASNAKWSDGWLEDDSIEGIKKQDINGAGDLNEPVNAAGSYTTEDGKPNKILLHTTEGTTNGYDAYPAGNKYPAHFIVDLKKREGYQNFSIDQPALAIKDYDQAGPIQVEIVGFSDPTSSGYTSEYDVNNFSEEDWDYLVTLLRAISEKTGVPLTSSVVWGKSAARLSPEAFTNYEGILGHMHAPANDHKDPGNIWQYIDAAIERSGGYDAACASSGGNGDVNATAIELAWPASEYGQHGWSDPNPAYAKALVETGVNQLGDACSMAGGSCDAFVTTVMRYSGADPDFYCCGITGGATLSYILSSGKYQEVSNGLGNLQPGDIRIGPNHIELYVEVNGEPHIAAASHCERSGDIGNYYDNDFRVFRLK